MREREAEGERFLRPFFPLLFLVGFLVGGGCGAAPGSFSRPADLDGIRAAMEAARGRPLVVNHWATWSGPCVDLLPVLARSARAHPDVVFLGIAWDCHTTGDDVEVALGKVAAAARRGGLPYESLVFTGEPEVFYEGLSLESRVVPQTLVFDARGVRVERIEGELEGEEALARAIARAKGSA